MAKTGTPTELGTQPIGKLLLQYAIPAISPTSVSKRKLRLKERIVQEIGSLGENQSLDLWLMEY